MLLIKQSLSLPSLLSRACWRGFVSLILLGALLSISACSEEEESGPSCLRDLDCMRGQLCEAGACTVLPCASAAECPGFDRTCVEELGQCSALECGESSEGEALSCTDPTRSRCVSSGAFAGSCAAALSPGTCLTDSDCAGSPLGAACCAGQCQASCLPPPVDMAPPSEDLGPPVDRGQPAGPAGLCSRCEADVDCAALGEGASCTALQSGSYCTSPCDGGCEAGYRCVEDVGQCIPISFDCPECLRTPCPEGQRCDIQSGSCQAPEGRCGACTEDAGCEAGLRCGMLDGASVCLAGCEGGCGDGFRCEGELCIPESGVCDACGGTCGGETPFCIEEEGRCGECGVGFPCGEGLSCNLSTYRCGMGMIGCGEDSDCNAEAPYCFTGGCVECYQDSQCPPRHLCNVDALSCVYDACARVECQRGSACDPATGRCTPGCQNDADCPPGDDTVACNQETGQCYFTNGGCDFGASGVCAPGGVCVPNAFDPMMNGVCSCAKLPGAMTPSDPLEAFLNPPPDLIPCQPGSVCVDVTFFAGLFAPGMMSEQPVAICGLPLF